MCRSQVGRRPAYDGAQRALSRHFLDRLLDRLRTVEPYCGRVAPRRDDLSGGVADRRHLRVRRTRALPRALGRDNDTRGWCDARPVESPRPLVLCTRPLLGRLTGATSVFADQRSVRATAGSPSGAARRCGGRGTRFDRDGVFSGSLHVFIQRLDLLYHCRGWASDRRQLRLHVPPEIICRFIQHHATPLTSMRPTFTLALCTACLLTATATAGMRSARRGRSPRARAPRRAPFPASRAAPSAPPASRPWSSPRGAARARGSPPG